PATALDAPAGEDLTTSGAPATGSQGDPASGHEILDAARQHVGAPYVWGGDTPAAFDCSGFTMYVFAQVGIDLPRTSAQQRYAGQVVPAAATEPGGLDW